ncbi:MAG: nucleotidyltransferase domain-containing protein, partial [Cellvibrionales bacterium]|nr:nucleotidyltransferase domain-containing protein [Cellvibrionales bacterium]
MSVDFFFSSRKELLAGCKTSINENRALLKRDFLSNPDNVEDLIKARSKHMDSLLDSAFRYFFPEHIKGLSLIAVGGYGRGELLPYSDIDLLLLADDNNLNQFKHQLEDFVTFLWDTNLDIGHAVRSIKVCLEQAADDLSTATNLLESRFLCGDEGLYEALFEAITSDDVLTSEEFFHAKIKEQTDRHKKLQESEYNLEPNVKNSPGGLRDIQTIGWVTKRHFDNQQPEGLIRKGFLSDEDVEILNNGQHFLFQIRFALHIFSGRKQDRLLFEYQKSIAKALGFEDDENSLGVEKLMKQYYRWVLALSELNEM